MAVCGQLVYAADVHPGRPSSLRLDTWNGASALALSPRFHVAALLALPTDLVADSVFLLVQRVLLLVRDMAAVLAGHHALFPANLMIFLV